MDFSYNFSFRLSLSLLIRSHGMGTISPARSASRWFIVVAEHHLLWRERVPFGSRIVEAVRGAIVFGKNVKAASTLRLSGQSKTKSRKKSEQQE